MTICLSWVVRLTFLAFMGSGAVATLPSVPGAVPVALPDWLTRAPVALGVLWLALELWRIAAARWQRLWHPSVDRLDYREPGQAPKGFGPEILS